MPLGKHETILVIEGKRHPCQPFTVVETTFEVNLFLRNGRFTILYTKPSNLLILMIHFLIADDIPQTYDNSPNFYSMERSFTLSPLRIDTTWPPTLLSRDTEFSRELLLKPSVSTDVVSSRSSPQNKVDDLLAMKDVEISHLRTEVKQLRQLVNEMDVTLTFLRMNNKSKVWHAHKMVR